MLAYDRISTLLFLWLPSILYASVLFYNRSLGAAVTLLDWCFLLGLAGLAVAGSFIKMD